MPYTQWPLELIVFINMAHLPQLVEVLLFTKAHPLFRSPSFLSKVLSLFQDPNQDAQNIAVSCLPRLLLVETVSQTFHFFMTWTVLRGAVWAFGRMSICWNLPDFFLINRLFCFVTFCLFWQEENQQGQCHFHRNRSRAHDYHALSLFDVDLDDLAELVLSSCSMWIYSSPSSLPMICS